MPFLKNNRFQLLQGFAFCFNQIFPEEEETDQGGEAIEPKHGCRTELAHHNRKQERRGAVNHPHGKRADGCSSRPDAVREHFR